MPRKVDPAQIQSGPGMANTDSVDANSFTNEVLLGSQTGLNAFLEGTGIIASASQIETTGSDGQYFTNTVQGNLDELSALIPPQPPTLGNYSQYSTFNGIPDWGILKLNDAGLAARGVISTTNEDADIYPYYWVAPEVADDDNGTNPGPFVVQGNDPQTDPTFNVFDGVYTGGGEGEAHVGGITRTGAVIETARILPPAGGVFVSTLVSGSLFPADRGVVALIHWPSGGDLALFLAQPLLERCPAAILLGQGISGQEPGACDGDPGGIFAEGDPTVFSFPGRATGQYDLAEIHAGVNAQTGDPLPDGPQPSAGQVRLGTDPLAGIVPVPGGIPILGAGAAATGGGNDNNFFGYRLPYLDDYTSPSGIQYTPLLEQPRYYEKPTISLDPGTDLTQAGDYPNFADDYWTYQLARYRHRFTFFMNACPPNMVMDQGSFFLLHFKKEADFESFIRDGVMPDDVSNGYELHSAGLVDYTNPESVDNLTAGGAPADPDIPASPAYHILRGVVAQDPEINPPAAVTATYDFTRSIDSVMFSSGVQYFVNNFTALNDGFQINEIDFLADLLYANSYLLGQSDDPLIITSGLRHRQPLMMYLGGFTSTAAINVPAAPAFAGTSSTQRIEFSYSEVGNPMGPYDLTTGPGTADQAGLTLLAGDPDLTFDGDDDLCHFWQDARIRAFAARPVGHQALLSTVIGLPFDRVGGENLLFHTTSHGPLFDSGAAYGNFQNGGLARASLETATKDAQEVFLDEVYRWVSSAIPTVDPTFNGVVGNLVGPGLPFPASKIEVPVRLATNVTFLALSYIQSGRYQENLVTEPLISNELQVGGFPDRNPPLKDGVTGPVPKSGLLQYPQTNYVAGYRPSIVGGDISVPQPDYSAATGDRVYVRCLDASYSRSLPEDRIDAAGQPFVNLFIKGLTLEDIAHTPGPGSGNTAIAVEVKVPGLTTWMDVGRLDGAGPSKQDPVVDGAGCQVMGVDTFNFSSSTTGEVGCQVRLNVGPPASLFENMNGGIDLGVVPLLLRITIKDTPEGRALNWTQVTADESTSDCRGVVSVGIVPKAGLA